MPIADLKTVLVLGSSGMLGKSLLLTANQIFPTIGVDIDKCDITNPEQVAKILDEVQPDWVINAAAYTDVDGCEQNPKLAEEINGQAPGNLALACRERGCGFLQVSTDFVFDGLSPIPYLENDPVGPLNEYGKSKLAGELATASQGGDYIIVRTSWLFGPGGKNFPATILEAAKTRPKLEVVSDQVGSPTFTLDLSQAILALIRQNHRGLFHFSGSGSCSWYEYARFVIDQAGLDTTILPISSEQSGRSARRPNFSVLDCHRFRKTTGRNIRSWEKMVSDYLALGREKT